MKKFVTACYNVVTVRQWQCWVRDNMMNDPGMRRTKDLFNKQLYELYSVGSEMREHLTFSIVKLNRVLKLLICTV